MPRRLRPAVSQEESTGLVAQVASYGAVTVRALRSRHQARSSRATKPARPPGPLEQVGTPSAAKVQARPWT